MKMSELIGRLPGAASQPPVTAYQGQAITNEPLAITGFVWPTFETVAWPDEATVLLVEAAGAVGKSCTAEALAGSLNWPLVRSEHAQVGSYSLSGLVQDALGFDSDYTRNVAMGSAGIIVDSLDEAHLRAGTQNFLAFLENIQNMSGARLPAASREGHAPSVVIFSRPDTAELVQLSFADQDLPLAVIRLSFFDRRGAEDFVESYLTRRFEETQRAEYNVFRAYPTPFRRLRDERFQQVLRVVCMDSNATLDRDWTRGRDFLGYAPVLIALAESLAVANPSAERRALQAALSSTETELLTDIVERILVREQTKFADQLSAKLRALQSVSEERPVDASDVYKASEQTVRVLAHVTGIEMVAPPPASLPASVRPVYEEAAERFIADHPFVRGRHFASVVFGDYVTSATCISLDARASLARAPRVDGQDVGPFFLTFLRRMHPDAPVPETLVGPLIQSWYQELELRGSAFTGHCFLTLVGDEGSIAFVDADPDGRGLDEGPRHFGVCDLSGALPITGPLKHVSIASGDGILLGARNEVLSLGPDTVIVGGEIQVEAESLNVQAREGQAPVVLAGQRLIANYLTQVGGATESLGVFTDGDCPPRLHAYVRQLGDSATHRIPYDDFVGLRAILTSFFNTVHLGLSARRERLDNDVVRRNNARERILKGLMDRGIVTTDGAWYCLDTRALAEVGFSLQDVKQGVPTDAVLNFLALCRFGVMESERDIG